MVRPMLTAAILLTATPALAGPKGYAVTELIINDQKAFTSEYAPRMNALVAKCGGHFIVATNESIVLRGDKPKGRVVIVEYPSLQAARACYDSATYKAAIPLRDKITTGRTFFVEGTAK